MFHKPKISVIIPCYNSEAFLQKAVDSVINQSLSELQIILVDDGSTDKTSTLLQQYKMSDNRVEVVTHHENLGLGAARNSGMAKATGEYIFFLDSDDYIHPNSFEVLYEKSKDENLDILQMQYIRHQNGQKKVMPEYLPPFTKPITGLEYFHQDFLIEPKACVKLWRTGFIKEHHLQFDSGYYEDMAMVFYATSIAQRINNILFPAYHYIIRQGSITNQKKQKAHIDGLKQSLILLQQLFTNQQLTDHNSSFPASFFLYLKELSMLALHSEEQQIISDTKVFVRQMTQKYRSFIKNNRFLDFKRRYLLQKSPFLYAKLKYTIKKPAKN